MVHWEKKQNIMRYELHFKEGLAHMPIHIHGSSMHEIFKVKQPV